MKKIRKNLFKTLLLISLLIPITGNSQSIIGGSQISIEDAPYQVSLENVTNSNTHYCGGSIISSRWVLTAAHCLIGMDASDIIIHAGSTVQIHDNVGQRIVAQSLHIHPSFNPNISDENDIALIFLSQPLQFNHAVVPIEYANSCNTDISDIAVGQNGFITGWGFVCNNCSAMSPVLKGVSIPLITQANAMTINAAFDPTYTRNISNNMLAFYNNGTSPADGDSGGPAIIDKNGYKIEIGLSSWGEDPWSQLPSIFTNIRNYATWIETTTGIAISPTGVDLYTKDKPWDMGFEPFNTSTPWASEDIWVRRQNDGIQNQVHENPEYYALAGNYNYVYVRVRNRGCTASTGNEELKLYWAKGSTGLSWPDYWNNSMSVAGNSLGNIIGTVTLPVIQPGDVHIAVFQWQPPNPADFVGLASLTTLADIVNGGPFFYADNPHHFCLLSRIVGTSDPISNETSNLYSNVGSNNNIAWKNLSVVDLDPNNSPPPSGHGLIGATVLIGDAWGSISTYDIEFKNPNYTSGELITDNAEVTIILDIPIWNKWEQGGFSAENFEIVDEEKKQVRLLGGSGKLKNLTFNAHERGLIHVGFNFLTEELPQNNQFFFEVNQINSATNEIVGGELYKVLVPNRPDFGAEAGSDKEIGAGSTVTLSALQISEDAIYNWYDDNGNLVHTGKDFTLTPDLTQKYKLEIIATVDGFKDYDEVEITVNKNKITALSPNPAVSNLFIDYDIEEIITSAYFVLVQHTSSQSNQYIIDLTTNSKQIDVSNLPNGTYTLVLICDGQITDYTNLIIQ